MVKIQDNVGLSELCLFGLFFSSFCLYRRIIISESQMFYWVNCTFYWNLVMMQRYIYCSFKLISGYTLTVTCLFALSGCY